MKPNYNSNFVWSNGATVGERHGTAGHRGAGLAIRRGHSPGRAGKRHVAAARADAGRPGSVTAPPATAFLDAIRDPAHERHAASATFDAAAKRVTAGGGRILGDPLELPGGSWVIQCADPQGAAFALEGKRGRSPVGYFERIGSHDSSGSRDR